jgi:hypothetical protein
MLNQATTTAAPTPALPVWLTFFGRFITQLLGERAHCDVVLQLKDGKIALMRVNRSYLPADLPRV